MTSVVSSGHVIFLKITLELSINLQSISRRVVDRVLKNNSPSNIFYRLLLLERYPPELSGGFGCYRHNWIKHLVRQGFLPQTPVSSIFYY